MEYRLIRSRRKTLALEINRQAQLIVRAPMRTPQAVIDRFVEEKRQWIQLHTEKMRQRMEAHPEPAPETEALLRKKARELLPPLVEHYAARMGVQPAGITVTGARTRFGSCSPKNRLCFSFRLMEYPREAIEYVVVHELAHIRHKNHGTQFYQEIGRVLPDWQVRRQLLR